MNEKTDGWESYTDETGRRHWRWPAAADRQSFAGGMQAETGLRQKIGLPEQLRAQYAPRPFTGK